MGESIHHSVHSPLTDVPPGLRLSELLYECRVELCRVKLVDNVLDGRKPGPCKSLQTDREARFTLAVYSENESSVSCQLENAFGFNHGA